MRMFADLLRIQPEQGRRVMLLQKPAITIPMSFIA
jgi:hypothetical protein